MQRRLIIFLALTCVIATGIGSFALSHQAAKADTAITIPSGSAYGLYVLAVDGSTRLSSGPFGNVWAGCNPNPPDQRNTSVNINLFHGLLIGSTINDTVTFTHSAGGSTVESTSTVEDLTIGNSLLGPLVKISALHAVADSVATVDQASSYASKSSFATLKIAGIQLPLRIPPNLHVIVPGLGSTILNEQSIENISSTNSLAVVNMVDITLTQGNILKQPAGTRIFIGHATTIDSTVAVPATLQSHAFGLYASLVANGLTAAQVGPIPNTQIGCTGGTAYASALNLATPLLVNGGIAETQTDGTITTSTIITNSYEKITNLNLLGGTITADVLETSAQATHDDTGGTRSGTFTMLGLSVAGTSISSDIHPNTRLVLPGLGYAILNEQYTTSLTEGYGVNAIDISITTANTLHLPVGMRIIVGHVDAGISLFH